MALVSQSRVVGAESCRQSLEALEAAAAAAPVPDFCYMMFTSGSTGRPKKVCGKEAGALLQQTPVVCGRLFSASKLSEQQEHFLLVYWRS